MEEINPNTEVLEIYELSSLDSVVLSQFITPDRHLVFDGVNWRKIHGLWFEMKTDKDKIVVVALTGKDPNGKQQVIAYNANSLVPVKLAKGIRSNGYSLS